MQKRVITHPVQRQFCQWLLKRHASAALERTVKQNCLGRMGLLNHRVTRLEKGPVPAAISKRTQGCFKSCGIHRQITKFTKEKAFLLPLRTKHHHPHEKKNQKSAGTEQKKPNQTKTNQKKNPLPHHFLIRWEHAATCRWKKAKPPWTTNNTAH